ncbi:MAG: galactose mutarotase, partial [Eubacterium sp.]|nr:galactose mutarotase [Eubacterium sp.]
VMKENYSVCLEPQFMPDGIHSETEPDMILRAGENYEAETTFRFSVI